MAKRLCMSHVCPYLIPDERRRLQSVCYVEWHAAGRSDKRGQSGPRESQDGRAELSNQVGVLQERPGMAGFAA